MKRGLLVAFLGLSLTPFAGKAAYEGDSIGTKIVNGKPYVMLRVTKGDNLSAISRQYNASVEFVKEVNSLPSTEIQVGQVILVPSRGGNSAVGQVNPSTPVSKPSGDPKKHKVVAGESLFAVARKYSVGVDQIKKWNKLTSDGLNVGQVLIVSDPNTGTVAANPLPAEKPIETKPVETPKQPVPVETKPTTTPVAQNNPPTDQPGVHVVKQGETLYGIARLYGMDARDLKVLNKIEDPNLKVGQSLRVKLDPPGNPNQGTGLMDMLESADLKDSAGVKEAYPDLKVLTAPPATMIAPDAKVVMYKDKATGRSYKRVEEEGSVGLIEDFITDQTKFYAFHRYLPVGSYIRIDFPEKGQSILAEVTNQLPSKDPHLVRLSAKCLDYLMIRQPGTKVKVRYVIPQAN